MSLRNRLAILIAAPLLLASAPAQEFRSPYEAEYPKMPLDAQRTDSGIVWFEKHRGDGPSPKEGDTIIVWYESWTPAKLQWESSWERAGPHRFVLGDSLILGWRELLPRMRVGQQIVCDIPPELAYGDEGFAPFIKSGDTLRFHIYLAGILATPEPPPFHPRADLEIESSESGLEWAVLSAGAGEVPSSTQVLHVRWTVWSTEGVLLGSTELKNTLFKGNGARLAEDLMPFVDEARGLLRPGARLWFQVSPALGYGDEARNGIAAGQTTIWELELVKVLDPLPLPEFVIPAAERVIPGPEGLRFEIVRAGPGRKPTKTESVRIHFALWNTRGIVVEESFSNGEPSELRVGGLLRGFRATVEAMPEGGIYRAVVPPDLAYGVRGRAPLVQPGEPVHLYVELIEILPDPQAVKTTDAGSTPASR